MRMNAKLKNMETVPKPQQCSKLNELSSPGKLHNKIEAVQLQKQR
jgi:hypothetical protein